MITSLDQKDFSDEEFNQLKEGLETAWASQATVLAEHWRGIRQALTRDQWKNLPNVARRRSLGHHLVFLTSVQSCWDQSP